MENLLTQINNFEIPYVWVTLFLILIGIGTYLWLSIITVRDDEYVTITFWKGETVRILAKGIFFIPYGIYQIDLRIQKEVETKNYTFNDNISAECRVGDKIIELKVEEMSVNYLPQFSKEATSSHFFTIFDNYKNIVFTQNGETKTKAEIIAEEIEAFKKVSKVNGINEANFSIFDYSKFEESIKDTINTFLREFLSNLSVDEALQFKAGTKGDTLTTNDTTLLKEIINWLDNSELPFVLQTLVLNKQLKFADPQTQADYQKIAAAEFNQQAITVDVQTKLIAAQAEIEIREAFAKSEAVGIKVIAKTYQKAYHLTDEKLSEFMLKIKEMEVAGEIAKTAKGLYVVSEGILPKISSIVKTLQG